MMQRHGGAGQAVISTYIEEMRVKFVMVAVPLTEYDNYVGTLKSMGSDEYTGIPFA
ncbi:hypothetical protein PAESOLCIP111_05165 [Paenibacillus solanacearum]|uniref:Uncharacterized protein n=1 Tax=Paenibacillus solanacearum TaxID=2048548 RepID=A0A916K701_9BACL|nr:hypothetical protein [Paenibacillus solanacearum]CAG7646424.1 hypothetical protein PAESOLCIP111_05165 [Paenibacillus solanacearum]